MKKNDKFILAEGNTGELNLFGFSLTSSKRKNSEPEEAISFASPSVDDGSSVILSAGTHQIAYHDLGAIHNTNSDIARIKKYREISTHPEVDQAIEEIINELVVQDDEQPAVELTFTDETNLSKKLIDSIRVEFDKILRLLQFNNNAQDIVRQWYVDGRKVYHIILNEQKNDIIELRSIDPINIKKVKEVEELLDVSTNTKVYKTVNEYFVFTECEGGNNRVTTKSTRISKDAIIYVPSGLLDEDRKNTISYLHKSIKTANQLKMLEDAMVIYRLVRAPERRVFRVDVGSLPAKKAEDYLQNIISKYRNKISYDASSGELMDKRQQLAMIEDFWLPTRGGNGTQIDTLPSGQAMSNEDTLYFQKKLFRSLNVPLNRLEQESQFSIGRATEISRDEVKFSKFISKLRGKFSVLFYNALKTKLVLKKIISLDEWEDLKDKIFFNYLRDNHFTELKEAELIRERLNTLREIEEYRGTYFSKEWVQKNVLRMSSDDIEEISRQMEKEKEEEPDDDDDDETDSMGFK